VHHQAGGLLSVVRYEKTREHSLDLTMTLGAAAQAGVRLIIRSAAHGPKVRNSWLEGSGFDPRAPGAKDGLAGVAYVLVPKVRIRFPPAPSPLQTFADGHAPKDVTSLSLLPAARS
jgi:hypothetical protein